MCAKGARTPQCVKGLIHMIANEEEKQRLSPQASCTEMYLEMEEALRYLMKGPRVQKQSTGDHNNFYFSLHK